MNGLVNDLLKEVAGMEARMDMQFFEDLRNPTATDANVVSPSSIKPRIRADLPLRLRQFLTGVAERRVPIFYDRLAAIVAKTGPNATRRLHKALAHLMREDAKNGRPFIAALVIGKLRGGLPSQEFFATAARLGRFVGDSRGLDAWAFHAREFHAAVAHWRHR